MNLILLPIILAILGYLSTTTLVINFLNTLTPFQGLIYYYTQLFIVMSILQYFGLVIGNIKITDYFQTIGELLIIFAFFIVVNNENGYIQHIVDLSTNSNKISPENNTCSNIYFQSEDGATYYLISKYVTNPNNIRLITFVFLPFILSYIGIKLINKKVSLSIL
jgi:uncharacterized membrane protein